MTGANKLAISTEYEVLEIEGEAPVRQLSSLKKKLA